MRSPPGLRAPGRLRSSRTVGVTGGAMPAVYLLAPNPRGRTTINTLSMRNVLRVHLFAPTSTTGLTSGSYATRSACGGGVGTGEPPARCRCALALPCRPCQIVPRRRGLLSSDLQGGENGPPLFVACGESVVPVVDTLQEEEPGAQQVDPGPGRDMPGPDVLGPGRLDDSSQRVQCQPRRARRHRRSTPSEARRQGS